MSMNGSESDIKKRMWKFFVGACTYDSGHVVFLSAFYFLYLQPCLYSVFLFCVFYDLEPRGQRTSYRELSVTNSGAELTREVIGSVPLSQT